MDMKPATDPALAMRNAVRLFPIINRSSVQGCRGLCAAFAAPSGKVSQKSKTENWRIYLSIVIHQ
jgi:hypothetical protein